MSQTNPWCWEEPLLVLEPVQDPSLVLALGDPGVLSSLLLPGKSRSCLGFKGSALVCQTPAAAGWGGWGSPLPALPKGYSLPASLQVFWHPGMSDGNGVPNNDVIALAALSEQGTFPVGMGMGSAPRGGLGCTGEAQAHAGHGCARSRCCLAGRSPLPAKACCSGPDPR